MENSIKTMSGGIAAETENINPNNDRSEESSQNQPNGTAEGTVMLKDAATEFHCVTSSLKNNIKSGKLPAFQENSKAPYRVHPAEVERFLRTSPGIASIFHPKAVTTGKSHTEAAAKEAVQEDGLARATEAVVESPDNKDAGQAKLNESEGKQTAVATKPRRRRRRGKGGTGQQHASIANPHILKALAGTSPEERLRITACLTELLGLVASA